MLVLLACGGDPCPEVPMTEGEAGLVVVADEHGEGWERADCFACHDRTVMHRTGCTPDVDLDAVREQTTDEASCSACHGDNGLEAQ